jgi:DNA-binding XRE family transcriptional regulator
MAQARKRTGLTQAKLADLVGVRRITILRVERSDTTPSVTLALAISRELGESVEALFGGGE